MSELNGADIWRIREALERDAALALGSALFAFSRLDMNVGLMVASIYRNTGRENQVPKADSMSFHVRLDFMEKYLAADPALDIDVLALMRDWLAQAHDARAERNKLVHGRWSADPHKGKVVNIVGLPSSDAQQTIEYTIEELNAFTERFSELGSRLLQARLRWHLP